VAISLIDNSGRVVQKIISNKDGYVELTISENIIQICFEKIGFVKKNLPIESNSKQIIRLLENDIIGYLESISFHPGEKVSVFVNSLSYYNSILVRHGIKVMTILDMGKIAPSIQEVPDSYFVENGLNWKQSFEFSIPESAIPGLYSIKLIPDSQNQKPYFLSFVVSTDPRKYGINSKILVLASSNNWQTYNIWGGRSRYRNFEHLESSNKKDTLRQLWIKYVPELIKDTTKKLLRKKFPITLYDDPSNFQFKRLSINRPHPNCSIEDEDPEKLFTSHLAASEWRLLAWLEKNNFSYDIVSGYELHKDPSLLKNYKTFILSSHSEYWSKEMYNGLKEYFYTGGSILNLSGNSIYREIEFYPDGSLRCISLRFSENAADESEIIGVRFDMRGYGTCAPYKIIKKDHWVFKDLKTFKGQTFGDISLNQPTLESKKKFESNPASSPGLTKLRGIGASGWETDKLTKTAPKDLIVVAKGMNSKGGGADMIIREKTTEHGLLFSSSSITFVGSLLVDEISSGIVKNVIHKSFEET